MYFSIIAPLHRSYLCVRVMSSIKTILVCSYLIYIVLYRVVSFFIVLYRVTLYFDIPSHLISYQVLPLWSCHISSYRVLSFILLQIISQNCIVSFFITWYYLISVHIFVFYNRPHYCFSWMRTLSTTLNGPQSCAFMTLVPMQK